MTTRILIMGLPGSGKTTFTQELVKRLMLTSTVRWFNADAVRKEFDDWDFTPEGRFRQVTRMRDMANNSNADYVICDFVCPTDEYRKVFAPDYIIWMDTITSGRFEDTNKLFENPKNYSYRITDWADTQKAIDWLIFDFKNFPKDSNLRSIVKAISWRTLGTIDTFILSWIITGRLDLAAAIGGIEIFTKIFLYWAHERLWVKIKLH